MKILSLKPGFGNDLFGVLICEWCGAEAKLVGGYNDAHWHEKVLPAFHCKPCGLNRAGEHSSPEVTARNRANGVNGI